MIRLALPLAALALLAGCSPHSSHSSWKTCESHLRKSYASLSNTPEALGIDVVSFRASGDTATYVCNVTVKHQDRKVDPAGWFLWIFAGAEFHEEYRHVVTLARSGKRWRVVTSETRRKP